MCPFATVRHNNCQILVDDCALKKCSLCHKYRRTLQAMVSKQKNSSVSHNRTSQSSHINYKWLNTTQIKQRLYRVAKAIKVLQRSKQRLYARIQKAIARDAVQLQSEDTDMVEELLVHVCKNVSKNSFQSILWEQQKKYNSLRNKCQMRWHPLIRFALSIKYKSTAAYNALGHFIKMPPERLLQDYTHWVKFEVGINGAAIQDL